MKFSSPEKLVPAGSTVSYVKYVDGQKVEIETTVTEIEETLVGQRHQRIDLTYPDGRKRHFNGIGWYHQHLPSPLRIVDSQR